MRASSKQKDLLALTIGAIGIVYGDLGTSPLYALQQTLPGLPITSSNILGILSIIFWSLILVISTLYVTVFLRADNDGQGGILALVSLLQRADKKLPRILFMIGIIGAGLLLGDGMITPAISVISAVEGLKVISPHFSNLITPISFLILFCLFLLQHFGTGKIGRSFGPILLIWFIIIALLGLRGILQHPSVINAINPYYAIAFLYHGGWKAYMLLGGIFLVITGAEAMYADLGHFGKTPIRIGWFAVALPALLLNYFGQGAQILANPTIQNTFYALAPSWFSFPLLILATVATVIASQAVISASFSLAEQAILLNVSPRLSIIHTSEETRGQVYVPQVNMILAIGTLVLVAVFKTSDALAAAYGMAVNLVMIIVAILIMCVAHMIWKWSIAKIVRSFFIFMFIDLAFLGANLHKILQGAWIPLLFALVIGTIMLTWEKGMKFLRSTYYMNKTSLPDIIKNLDHTKLTYVEDVTTIFITDPYDKSGGTFLHYLTLNHIMPKDILIVSIKIDNYPFVTEDKRFELKTFSDNIKTLILHYGFMQEIDVPSALEKGKNTKAIAISFDIQKALYLVEFINIAISKEKHPRIYYWQKKMFNFLLKNSEVEIEFFQLPYDRTIAIGTYCQM